MHLDEFLTAAVLLLGASTAAVLLFQRAGFGSVLGLLVVGVVLGPHTIGPVVNLGPVAAAAELGVVFLLFVIGLELELPRVWAMRHALFGLGSLQVAATGLVLAAAVAAAGRPWSAALVLGFGLALSSTAFVLPLLAERDELATEHGRAALAILLLQDMAVIPLLAIVPLLAPGSDDPDALSIVRRIGQIGVTLAAIVGFGHLVLPRAFTMIARQKSAEAFAILAVLAVLAAAWLAHHADLSPALGAFIVGVSLSRSPFHHQVSAEVAPFKGLLLGLFFVTVGVSVDWFLVSQHLVRVVLGVVILLAVKFALLYLLGRSAGRLDRPGALRLAALLSQGGEFAFLLLTIAYREQLLPGADRDQITAVVVLSMALTPLIVLAIDRLVARQARAPKRPFDDPSGAEAPRVIIAGFGRVGQIVARLLTAHRIPFTALEQSVDQVELSRRFGNLIYYGDPTRPELLRAARADRAEIFVVATDDPEANVRTARLVKRQFPHLKVYARARNRQHAFRLMDLQLDGVVRETLWSSLELARHVLIGLGLPPEAAAERVDRFRRHDERMLDAQHAVYDDETKLVQSAKEAMTELEQLFEADLRDDALVASRREATRET